MKLMISGVIFSAATVRSPSFSRSSSSTTMRIRPARISSMASGTETKGMTLIVVAGASGPRLSSHSSPAPYVKMENWAGLPRTSASMSKGIRFLPLLPNLTLPGVIDILVVAFLVYQALMVVRGTRASHVLIGIFILVLLYAASVWAALESLRAVLSFTVPLIGLAIIVLFQSEIRRTLARLGRKRWLGLGAGYRAPESVNEILMAVEVMAPKRVGALIVLERDIGLRTFIESGVTLDARI